MQFFEQAFETAPIAMMVVTDRTIVQLNRQVEVLFGYPREALRGAAIDVLLDPQQRWPDSTAHALHELMARRQDGSRLAVEVDLAPLRERNFVLASIFDMSERRRAEERFRLAIEAAPNGMMMVDERGRITLVNAQLEQIFGYSRAELIGEPVEKLLPQRYQASHVPTREAFFGQPRTRPMGAGRELFGAKKDGTEVPVEIGLSPLTTPSGRYVLSSIVDITSRKQAHESLRNSLSEKEALLRELHHRAKNNLQLVTSLLDLVSGQHERDVDEVLAECRDRIGAISLVHEMLYQHGTFAHVQLDEYLGALTEQIVYAWRREAPVELEVGSDADLSLPLERAVPCGLIVNELATNAFKHAFPDGRAGTISVQARRLDGDRIALTVRDDGVGMPPEQSRRPGSIGLELVRALARQLSADVQFAPGAGTSVRCVFKVTA